MVDNVIMPETVSVGFRSVPTFSTDVLAMVNGQERRLQNRSVVLHKYFWEMRNADREMIEDLRDFWFDRRADFKTFLMKDWSDFEAIDGDIGVADGVEDEFQIIKIYTAGNNPYERTIRHLKADTLVIYLDGEVVSGVDYTVSATGLITFDAPPGSGIVSADFEFYVPVRFDGDEFPQSVPYQNEDIISVDGLRAIEVIP